MPNGKLIVHEIEYRPFNYSFCKFAYRILKNGGTVRFVDGRTPITDYNALLDEQKLPVLQRIHTIDATDSAIMALGFDHLDGCHSIERIILNRCKHMENNALEKLTFVKDTLHHLQVTECGNVEDSGLRSLKNLSQLKTLTIHGFLYVKDFNGICNELKQSLPQCQIATK